MAKIKKIQSGAKSSFIWMGTCDDGEDCQDFDLTSYAVGESNAGIISSVFQMGDNNIAGVWKSDQPGFANDLNDGSTDNNKMLCGKNYFIKLHPATSGADETEIEIPGAIFDYKGQVGKGKVFNKDSTRPQFLGDVSNLPSCIAKGEFRNLITKAEDGTDYATDQTITPDKDGIYVKGDGTVHRIFSGKPFNIPAGSKLFKGKFGTLDTDGDGVPDEHDTNPSTSDRDSGQATDSFTVTTASNGDYNGVYQPIPGSSVDGLPIYQIDGVRDTEGPVFWGEVDVNEPSETNTNWRFAGRMRIVNASGVQNAPIPEGHVTTTRSGGSNNFTSNFTSDFVSNSSGPWDIPESDWAHPYASSGSGINPTKIGSSGGITGSIAVGWSSSYALKADGSLHATGDNYNDQFGDGTTTNRNSFSVVGLSEVSQIAVGKWHTLFVKTDGSLHSVPASGWPASVGDFGQRGDQSQHTSGVSQVAAGEYHSLMLKSDGSVWSAGNAQYGQLGEGSFSSNSFKKIIDSGATQIAAGDNHSLVLKSDGSLHAFGRNNYGQLGVGTTTNRNTPTQVYSSGVSQIAAGGYHSLILKTDGSLHAFGRNNYGQLGDGDLPGGYQSERTIPTEILSSGVAQVSAGMLHSLILKTDGSLHAFGRNSYGQLGDGTNSGRPTPTQIVASGVSQIAAGGEHSVIVKADGSLHAFGRNDVGQLGDGTSTSRNTPTQIFPAGSI